MSPLPAPERRVYPLTTSPDLTEEEIAVAFAMTSRRPEGFDEIAHQLTLQKAAAFHEKWVLDYGHSSVAEHAVMHLAVENISRVACDILEDNRLASYTEKSSRYQVLAPGHFHTPRELEGFPKLKAEFKRTCNSLFETYAKLLEGTIKYLNEAENGSETKAKYPGQPPRVAPDHCRAILPAATLTNVGMTANARAMQHALSKLLSHPLTEARDTGKELTDEAKQVTPTLLKHAGANGYLNQRHQATWNAHIESPGHDLPGDNNPPQVELVDHTAEAVEAVTAAILFNREPLSYRQAADKAAALSGEQRAHLIGMALAGIGPHDSAPREFEAASYTFAYTMDYGALREFKRHRIQTYITQPLTVHEGYSVPPLVRDAGMADPFRRAVEKAEHTFRKLAALSPHLAQYAVTHAHNQRVLSILNLRECYHLFKLRTSGLAHFAVRAPVTQAMKLAVETHPELFRGLILRDEPDWWPYGPPTDNAEA